MASFVADRRLYLTADKERVVEEGDPEAAFLLCAEGRAIHPDHVDRYGLEREDGKVVIPGQEPEAKSVDAPEDKMAGPPEDKAHGEEEEKDIEVEQNGAWFTIYVDGEEVEKVQGKEARDEVLEALE